MTIGMDGGLARMWKYFLHVAALASLSLAQPIFDLLSRYPQVLVAHHAGLIEIGLLILLICLVVPGSVAAAEWLQYRTVGARDKIRGAGIALFVFPLGLVVPKQTAEIPAVFVVGAAVVLAWGSRWAYLRYRTVRLYLTFLSPAILVVPILFLTGPSVQRMISPATPRGPAMAKGATDVPIVVVVFDELPLSSLLDRHGGIDSRRFPSFAELGGQATWYRNTTAVSYSTQYSVPAMLTGNRPEADPAILPTLSEHGDNLFTWLRNSHRLNVFETTTHLCPECRKSRAGPLRNLLPLLRDLAVAYLHRILPEKLTTRLPDVRQGWALPKLQKWWRDHPMNQFETFLEGLRNDGNPSLNFIHVQVPHMPWIHLPSGKRYLSIRDRSLFLLNEIWPKDEGLVTLAYQRHLLQVGLADRLLGRLLQKLEELRLFDRSLIVIASDHGVSFRPGGSRRKITAANFHDLLAVPLLIKAPYQRTGRVSERPTQTTDIFPSIAGILGVPVPWSTDGTPVTESVRPGDRDLVSIAAGTFPPSRFLRYRTTICRNGAAIEVSQAGAWSYLDIVSDRGGKISLFGWAADIATLKPADSILVFADGDLVYRGMRRRSRPDVVEYYGTAELENAGFDLELDRGLFDESREVRCFAVFGDRIHEARYPENFPWKFEPEWTPGEVRFSQSEPLCSVDRAAPGSFLINLPFGPEDLKKAAAPSPFVKRLRHLAWDAGPDGLFRLGPADALLGKPLDRLPVTRTAGLRIELDRPGLYERVQLDHDFIPAAVEGWVSAADARHVAVAINGTLRTVAPAFAGADGRRRFQALVPESSFLNGANRVRVFVVAPTTERVVLLASPENP